VSGFYSTTGIYPFAKEDLFLLVEDEFGRARSAIIYRMGTINSVGQSVIISANIKLFDTSN
jgi:hypothetical protein